MKLYRIQQEVERRAQEIAEAHGSWPCHKGCDDCCRSLAAEPRVSREEWERIGAALARLPEAAAEAARGRMIQAAEARRPVVCPLLDRDSGSCLVYEARPAACQAYGFYADRGEVLGCGRIARLAEESPEVIWGNHAALEERLAELGPAREFSAWLKP